MGKIDTKLEKESVINEELKQSNDVEQPKTSTDGSDGSQVASNAEEITKKTDDVAEAPKTDDNAEDDTEDVIVQELTKTEVIHVIEYTGHGAWVDNTGRTWARKSSNKNIISSLQLSDEEYATRTDLHFMIKYGEMSHTIVNI